MLQRKCTSEALTPVKSVRRFSRSLKLATTLTQTLLEVQKAVIRKCPLQSQITVVFHLLSLCHLKITRPTLETL